MQIAAERRRGKRRNIDFKNTLNEKKINIRNNLKTQRNLTAGVVISVQMPFEEVTPVREVHVNSAE